MNKMLNFKFGDIILINYPFSDLSKYKKRPCLVLKENRDDVLVVFISSLLENKQIEDIILKKDNMNNLIQDSVLKILKINNVHKKLIDRKIGFLNKIHQIQIKKTLIEIVEEL
jgi:mRNA interferase MazF